MFENIIAVVVFAVSFVGGVGAIALAAKLLVAVSDDMAASRELRAPMKAHVLRRR